MPCSICACTYMYTCMFIQKAVYDNCSMKFNQVLTILLPYVCVCVCVCMCAHFDLYVYLPGE